MGGGHRDDAVGCGEQIEPERFRDGCNGSFACGTVEAQAPCQWIIAQDAGDDVGIRERRVVTAPSVGGRTRNGTRAVGPYAETAGAIDARDAPPPAPTVTMSTDGTRTGWSSTMRVALVGGTPP